MSDACFTEFDAQHIELLPARTVLSAITLSGWGGDGYGGDGVGGDGGSVFVEGNVNEGFDQVITATGGAGGAGTGGEGGGNDGIEIEDNGGVQEEANGDDLNGADNDDNTNDA